MPASRKHPPQQLPIDPDELTKQASALKWDNARKVMLEQEQAALEAQPAQDKTFRYSDEEKILIVLDAKHLGVTKAAVKYGTTNETIRQWIKRLDTDEIFRAALDAKKYQVNHDFEKETSESIKACLDFIKRAAMACDVTHPGQIRAVAGAMKMAAEFRLAEEITRARLGKAPPQKALPAGNNKNPDMYVIENRFQKLEHINEDAGVESVVDGDFSEEQPS